jgi:hypothetical protein
VLIDDSLSRKYFMLPYLENIHSCRSCSSRTFKRKELSKKRRSQGPPKTVMPEEEEDDDDDDERMKERKKERKKEMHTNLSPKTYRKRSTSET